jgi:AraC-like DNA-binding protein
MTVFIDFYLVCILISVVNLFTTALLMFVLRKARHRKANLILGILLICLGVTYGTDVLYDNHFYEKYPYWLHYDIFLTLSLGPLLYFYIQYQTRPDFRLRPVQLLHLLPLGIYFLLLFDFFTDPSLKATFLRERNLSTIPHARIAIYFRQAQTLFYIIWCYRLLIRHNRVIQELASSIERKQLKWLRDLMLAATGLYVVGFLSIGIDFINDAVSLLLLLFSGWITYQAVKQEYVFGSVAMEEVLPIIEEAPRVRYRNTPLTKDDLQRLMQQVTKHITYHKPYLDNELSLTTLAEQLQMNPNLLSQVLNEGFGENFYKFVNQYRVEESKRLLLDPAYKHYTILAIALEAGFSSKSTFNRTFKEIAGCSPSEFTRQKE